MGLWQRTFVVAAVAAAILVPAEAAAAFPLTHGTSLTSPLTHASPTASQRPLHQTAHTPFGRGHNSVCPPAAPATAGSGETVPTTT